jgi:hypothetical protein
MGKYYAIPGGRIDRAIKVTKKAVKNAAIVAGSTAAGRFVGEVVGDNQHPVRQVVRGAKLLHDKIGTTIPVDNLVTIGQQAHDAAVQTGHWAGGVAAGITAAAGLAINHNLSKSQHKGK